MRLYRRTQKFPDGTERTWGPWWVQYHHRGRLVRRSLRTRDKRAAEIAAAELLKKEELKSAGVFDPHEDQKVRPLDDHLAEFEAVLLARDVVEKYRKERMGTLRTFAAWANAKRLGDLDVADASRWVNELARTGLSARGLNSRISGLRQLGAWVFATHRLPYDPFSTLELRNEDADRRHVRRALSRDEVDRLLDAARRGTVERARAFASKTGLSPTYEARLRHWGAWRAVIYELAVGTGLRANEIRTLAWGAVDLDRGRARVTARFAKSRKEQAVELHDGLVETLRSVRPKAVLPTTPVVPPRCFPTIRTFDADLATAGIAKRDDAGRVVDFHALRHTFVSRLSEAGVHPRVAMALARHSDLSLTMRHYTDVSLLDLKGAVAKAAGRDGASAKARTA